DPDFEPYDVVISSEVIEHIADNDKDTFVTELEMAVAQGGHVIITTPRGEDFEKFRRLGCANQPVEAWLTEKELQRLFLRHRFVSIAHDRVYLDMPGLSLVHRFSASRRAAKALERLKLAWLAKGLQYVAGTYQVWLFQRTY